MKPPYYPKILYKYRSWDNEYHKKVLTENKLYLAPSRDFNDPIDCQIDSDYSLLNTDEKIEEYEEILIKRHSNSIIKNRLDPNQVKEQKISELKTNMSSVQKEHDECASKMFDKYFGIFSLSSRWDSILMWSHYADSHKGFCVGFSETMLRNSGLFSAGGLVNYDDKFPKIDPRKNRSMGEFFLKTNVKAKDWSYEKEYRLIKSYPNGATNLDRIVEFQNHFISEIVLGLKISECHKKEIIEISEEKGIPVFQIEQVPFEFKLVKKPLNNE